jgi:Protein of unknown function (DUF1115)
MHKDELVQELEIIRSLYSGSDDEFQLDSLVDIANVSVIERLAFTVNSRSFTSNADYGLDFVWNTHSCVDVKVSLSRECSKSISTNRHQDLSCKLGVYLQSLSLEMFPSVSAIVMEAMQWLSNEVEMEAALQSTTTVEPESQDSTKLVFAREWVYFPTLSTKEKRSDLRTYALEHKLTGFVTPGKPGILVVEGLEEDINRYLHEIRTISWADLPPSHKKLTLTHREKFVCDSYDEMDSKRKFKGMEEHTFDLHGARRNHNSLVKLKEFLDDNNCHEAFGILFPEHNSC